MMQPNRPGGTQFPNRRIPPRIPQNRPHIPPKHPTPKVTESAGCVLKTKMRKLWEDHVFWTRNVILCVIDNLPGEGHVVNRLLKNQDDISDFIASYYGAEKGNVLRQLLKSHIIIAYEVLSHIKSGNELALIEANKKWRHNADELISFFTSQ